jgi:hypothetical protein
VALLTRFDVWGILMSYIVIASELFQISLEPGVCS